MASAMDRYDCFPTHGSRRRRSGKTFALALLLAAPVAWAQTQMQVDISFGPHFEVGVDPLGDLRPPQLGPHQGSHGSTIVVDEHGLLVVEREEGVVVRARKGQPFAELRLAPGLGEIVRDATAKRVFVAERGGDRLLELDPGDKHGRGLGIRASVEIREPHGLALTPDGNTLLVTSVADHELVGVDLRDGELTIAWRVALLPEPRGVAVSPDGKRAIVGFLSTGALALLRLPEHEGEPPRVRYRSLEPRDQLRVNSRLRGSEEDSDSSLVEARSRFEVPSDTGRRSARNTFAVAFVGHGLAVAPHELATPQLTRNPAITGTYGGGDSFSPITHALSRLGTEALDGAAATAPLEQPEIDVDMPRSLAYELARDTLYVGGYGDDSVVAIANVSQGTIVASWRIRVGDESDPCGIDGLAVDGDSLWIHCEFGRELLHFELGDLKSREDVVATRSAELTKPIRPPEVEHGAELFRRAGDSRLTLDGTLACAQCHPEGRSDGLSWRLEGAILQTPILAGRLVGTAPYKWDGQDLDFTASVHATILRLGGRPEAMTEDELHALRAYIESLPAPRSPTPSDPEAIARGREVFESPEAACDACHEGSRLTDNQQHVFETALAQVDTPSLIGLAHSAPYYHDASAVSIEALLANRSNIHDMADTSKLTVEQLADLGAYLESL
jgi:mono/diheme cytochrome c family protein